MKTKLSISLLIAVSAIMAVAALAYAADSSLTLPKDWFKAGSLPKAYDMGLIKGAGQNGANAASIKSIDKSIDGFGTLMQMCKPGKYAGKRVRMTGYMKSADVGDWAGFWFRVDGEDGKQLSFDNMGDRPVKGTTDWKKYEIVLDVPADSKDLAYGALLGGTGQVWFSNITFEIVDNSVPVTEKKDDSYYIPEPSNLDFGK